MGITSPYATAAEYRASSGQRSGAADGDLDSALLAVSRLIEHCLDGRCFNQDEEATAHVYLPQAKGRPREGWAESENPWLYGGLTRLLEIDDVVTINSITVDENRDNTFSLTLTTTDYEKLPRNALVRSEVRPYSQIQLTEWGSQVAWTPGARVKVTGIHGWPAVPAAIKIACIEMTRVLRLDGPRATGRIQEDVGAAYQTSREAQGIIHQLKQIYGRGVFF